MGGPVVKVRALAHALAKHTHQITVLTADWGLNSQNGHGLRLEPCGWGWRAAESGVAAYVPWPAHYRALTLNLREIRFREASLKESGLVHFYGLSDLFGAGDCCLLPARTVRLRNRAHGYVPPDRSRPASQIAWHRSA